mgnify:CR=1 FL=1
MTARTVSVFGSYEPRDGDGAYEDARAVGRRLAELGYAVANGGYGGTMEATARGAKEAGGRTIGVTCSVWPSRPNEYIDDVVHTDNLMDRIARLIELADGGFVVLPGGTGTLAELAMTWEKLCKRMISPRPLVCVGGFWRPVIEAVTSARPASGASVRIAADAIEMARAFRPAEAFKE